MYIILWPSNLISFTLTICCCSINSDGLSPLDVAVLSNNRLLVKMLVGFGAKEGNQCEYSFSKTVCKKVDSKNHLQCFRSQQ